jgi:hypothetical protein
MLVVSRSCLLFGHYVLNDLLHFVKNSCVGSHNFAAKDIIIPCFKITYLPACLLNKKSTGRHIPGLQIILIKSVKPATGDISQICCCRSQAAESMTIFHEKVQRFHKIADQAVIGVWEACRLLLSCLKPLFLHCLIKRGRLPMSKNIHPFPFRKRRPALFCHFLLKQC